MAKNPDDAVDRRPKVAAAAVRRKTPVGGDVRKTSGIPKTAGAPPEDNSPSVKPFSARHSDARQVAGRTPRPSDRSGQ